MQLSDGIHVFCVRLYFGGRYCFGDNGGVMGVYGFRLFEFSLTVIAWSLTWGPLPELAGAGTRWCGDFVRHRARPDNFLS
jgi:hypothetical protein